MIIYVDVLIIINIYITYFILKATARLLHLGYKTGRIIAASVLGGISALSAVIPMGFIPAVLLRSALTMIITAAAFGFSGFKPLLLRSGITIVSASLVCGGAILMRELTGSTFFGTAGGYPYLDISVMTLIIATTAVYIAITLFRRFSDKPDSGELIQVKIKHGNKTAVISAYPDSGNNLRDFLTGMPVIVCRKDKISHIFPLDGDFSEDIPPGTRLIPFSSVGGKGFVTAFRPDSVTVSRGGVEKTVNVLIGTGGSSLDKEEFDAILNPKILI